LTSNVGNLFHVKYTGNDGNSGTFNEPWAIVSKGDYTAVSGDTLYIHLATTGGASEKRAIYNIAGFKARI
jgi:hypothetical protein